MSEEFDLSKKGWIIAPLKERDIFQMKYWEEDVKEFIRRLKWELKKKISSDKKEGIVDDDDFYFPIIDKLAGEKLK